MNLAELLDGLPEVAVYTLSADVSRGELVASSARLGMTLAELGLSTGQVVAAMLPNDAVTIAALFGTWRAGGVYTPLNPRAADAELISQVVEPPEKLREVAQTLAEKIAKNSPSAMRATKRALWGALEHGLTDACREGAKHLTSMWGHPDQNEGPQAFADKRSPNWLPLESDS